MLCLDKPLYRAFIQLQAAKDLGRAYAGLLPFVEGLHKLGFLSEEEHTIHVKKYSEPLTDESKVEIAVISHEQRESDKELKVMDKYFLEVMRQWENHKDLQWRVKAKVKAEHWKEKLQSAKDLLSLIDQCEQAAELREDLKTFNKPIP
jgi:hypothetical protein